MSKRARYASPALGALRYAGAFNKKRDSNWCCVFVKRPENKLTLSFLALKVGFELVLHILTNG
jgi:hypothetical protein